MTQDFKDNILDYITNNVNENNGNNIPQMPSFSSVSGNVKNYVTTELSSAQSISLIGSLTNELDNNIIYYGYYKTNDRYYGFIYIVNEQMETVKFITTFSSGSYLFPIVSLNQDENNYIYALALDYNDLTKGRVLLLNNIFTGKSVILRSSYLIPNNYQYLQYTSKSILKVADEATYFIVVQKQNTGTYVIKFTINVGSDNEWNVYSLNGDIANYVHYDVLIEKENDNIIYHLYTILSTHTTLGYETYAEYKIENDVITRIKYITLDYNIFLYGSYVIANSTDEIYIGTYTNQDAYFRVKKVVNNNLLEIFNFLNPTSQYVGTICMKKISGIVVFYYGYYQSTTKYGKVAIIQNNNAYSSEETLSQLYSVIGDSAILVVKKTFNLLKIYTPTDTNTAVISLDYNPLNYNGSAYSSYNQTVSSKGRLYSNSNLVFARNIYNTTLLNSTTTSTIQIPNTLLNNTTITQEDLIGDTNTVLTSNNTSITKNIYETLYINFINTLNVIDEDTNVKYPLAATYINQNINIGTKQNCQDTFIGKVQIIYSDKTIMQNIVWAYDTDHYETEFTIDASSEVPSLTFISNDLSTIYLEKELDITTGNYYLIKQKLRIE